LRAFLPYAVRNTDQSLCWVTDDNFIDDPKCSARTC
jgi:hypothetical protein